MDVFSLPRTHGFTKLGKGKITHDKDNGFVLTGHYNGADYRIQRKPLEINKNLFTKIKELGKAAVEETETMKELVSELVPTYKIDRRN